MRSRLTYILISVLVLLPAPALALTTQCPTGLNCNPNPDVNELILSVINWLLSITLVIDILFLIFGGFFFIISGGNEERREKGKDTIINAIVGLIIIMLSYVIAYSVSNFFMTA